MCFTGDTICTSSNYKELTDNPEPPTLNPHVSVLPFCTVDLQYLLFPLLYIFLHHLGVGGYKTWGRTRPGLKEAGRKQEDAWQYLIQLFEGWNGFRWQPDGDR